MLSVDSSIRHPLGFFRLYPSILFCLPIQGENQQKMKLEPERWCSDDENISHIKHYFFWGGCGRSESPLIASCTWLSLFRGYPHTDFYVFSPSRLSLRIFSLTFMLTPLSSLRHFDPLWEESTEDKRAQQLTLGERWMGLWLLAWPLA